MKQSFAIILELNQEKQPLLPLTEYYIEDTVNAGWMTATMTRPDLGFMKYIPEISKDTGLVKAIYSRNV